MTLLALAPLAESLDMFIALAICYLPIIPFLILAYKASKSGSFQKESLGYPGGTKWVESKINLPFLKQGWFKFAIFWFVVASIFFWFFLWPDHHDVWFINE
jgi:hypothetical protein